MTHRASSLSTSSPGHAAARPKSVPRVGTIWGRFFGSVSQPLRGARAVLLSSLALAFEETPASLNTGALEAENLDESLSPHFLPRNRIRTVFYGDRRNGERHRMWAEP
jgi:hypothetical protein